MFFFWTKKWEFVFSPSEKSSSFASLFWKARQIFTPSQKLHVKEKTLYIREELFVLDKMNIKPYDQNLIFLPIVMGMTQPSSAFRKKLTHTHTHTHTQSFPLTCGTCFGIVVILLIRLCCMTMELGKKKRKKYWRSNRSHKRFGE